MAKRIKVVGDYEDNISPGVKRSGDSVKKQSSEIKRSNEQIKKSFDKAFNSDAAKKFSAEVKQQVKSSTDEIQKSFKKQQGVVSRTIGTLAGLGVAYLKLKLVQMVVAKGMTTLATAWIKGSAAGGKGFMHFLFKPVSAGMHKLYKTLLNGPPIARAFANVMYNALHNSLAKTKASSEALKKSLKDFIGRLPVVGNHWKKLSSTIQTGGARVSGAAKRFDMLAGKLTQLSGLATKAAAAFVKFLPAILAVVAAIVALKVIKGAINDIAQLGDKVDKLSQRISMSGVETQKWARVLRLSGTSIEEVETGLARFQKNVVEASMGAGQAADAFAALGVEAKQTNGNFKSNEDLFKETILKLADMEDTTLRNAMAMQLFGRSGAKIVPVLNQGSEGIQQLLKDSSKYVVITKEAQKASAAFVDITTDLGAKFKQMKVSVVTASMNLLSNAFETLIDSPILEFIGMLAKKLGTTLAIIIGVVTKLFQVLDLTLRGLILTVKGFFTLFIMGIERLMNMLPDRLVPDSWQEGIEEFSEFLKSDFVESSSAAEKALQRLMSFKPDLSQTGGPAGVDTGGLAEAAAIMDEFKKIGKTAREQELQDLEKWHEEQLLLVEKNLLKRNVLEAVYLERRKAINERHKTESKGPAVDTSALSAAAALMDEYRKIGKSERDRELIDLENWYNEQQKLVEKGLVQQNLLNAVYLERSEAIYDSHQQTILEKQRELLEKELALIEEQMGKVEEAMSFFGEVALKAIQDPFARRRAELKQHLDQEIELIREHATAVGMSEQQTQALITQARENAAAEHKRIDQQETTTKLESIDAWASKFAEATSTITSAISNLSSYQMDIVNEDADRRKEAAELNIGNERQRARAIQKIEQDAAQKRKEIRKRDLVAQMIMAIANTAQAVTHAYATNPTPLNFIMAGLVGAAGAVQTAIIGAQISKLAKGGIIPGHGDRDTEPALLTPGEMVLNREQQARLFAIANGRSGGGNTPNITISDTIVVNGNLDSAAAEQIRVDRERQLKDLQGMIEELNYRGQLTGVN